MSWPPPSKWGETFEWSAVLVFPFLGAAFRKGAIFLGVATLQMQEWNLNWWINVNQPSRMYYFMKICSVQGPVTFWIWVANQKKEQLTAVPTISVWSSIQSRKLPHVAILYLPKHILRVKCFAAGWITRVMRCVLTFSANSSTNWHIWLDSEFCK